jgi:hypothetical protein
MLANDRIGVAQSLAADGNFRPAVEVLRDAIAQDPHDTALRIALAELYRDRGYPDQAGRWGAIVPGWATDRELRLFARSFYPEATPERIATVLRTTVDRVSPELVDLVRDSARTRRERSAEASRGAVAFGIAGIALIVLVVGSICVFVAATLELRNLTAWARVLAASVAFLGVLSSSLWLVRSLSRRHWGSAVVSLAISLALFSFACWIVALLVAD